MLVEVCANSLASALNAQKAGADRIELCSELGVGGVTPSAGVIQLVKKQLDIPIHVLIRPRSAHFTYSDSEFQVMLADIEFCKKIGVAGIVSGVLLSNGELDEERTKQLVQAAKPLHFTFHRAYDWVPNSIAALKKLEQIGVDAVLTSGKHLTAESGIENLINWQQQTEITIMAGAGINADNAPIFKNAGLNAIHLSGTTFKNEVSINRKVPMNSQNHLQEYHVAVTNEGKIWDTILAVR